MLFSEPSPTPYDLRFALIGIPVRVSPMFWLVALFLGIGANPRPLEMVLWVAAVFVSILVHEMGHALVARAYGFHPWVTLHAFGGLASYQPGRHNPQSEVVITIAGPAAGFLFAGLILAALAAAGHPISISFDTQNLFDMRWAKDPLPYRNANSLVSDLLFVNILWGVINLLPVWPLDGGRIARVVLMELNPGQGLIQSLWLGVIAGGAAAFLAYARLQSLYTAIFFAYMAFTNYQAVQAYTGRGGWGGYS